MQNKKTMWVVIGFVLVAIIFFYVGDKYASGKSNGANLTQNSGMRNFGGGQNGGARGGRGGGAVFGTILAKDATSITVQLNNFGGNNGGTQTAQGSKIVFYTGSTTVLKTVDGTSADLVVGKTVSVNGTPNTDGSVSATSIQLRTVPQTPPSGATQGQ